MDKQLTERSCPACGVRYLADPVRLRHGRQTTCSRACSYAFRFNRLKNKVRITCSVCGLEVERSPAHIKGKHGGQFCSRRCHYAGRSLGLSGRVVTSPYRISEAAREAWKRGAAKIVAKRRLGDNYQKSDETRAKLSEATARALAEGKIGRPSKLEDKVAVELDRLGVRYVRQHAFRDGSGRFAVVLDFWLPDTGAAIEVNGTYWHADPRAYPASLNSMQVRCVAKYRRKLDALRQLGIRVGEAWELDLKADPAKAVLIAYQRAIGA